MNKEKLDKEPLNSIDLSTNESLKNRLLKRGFENIYEMDDRSITIEESHTVQVSVRIEKGKINVKSIFPQIGNTIQIIATVVLLFLSFTLGLRSYLPWIVSISGGQLISYLWHFKKIRALKESVEEVLLEN